MGPSLYIAKTKRLSIHTILKTERKEDTTLPDIELQLYVISNLIKLKSDHDQLCI